MKIITHTQLSQKIAIKNFQTITFFNYAKLVQVYPKLLFLYIFLNIIEPFEYNLFIIKNLFFICKPSVKVLMRKLVD